MERGEGDRFQSVILQRAQGINNSTQIFKGILFRLDFWNRELLKNTYNSAMRYLRKACANQTEEQHHRTFSKLVLKGKSRKSVQFVCDGEKRRVLQPYELAEDRTGMINETVILVFEGKHASKTNPSCDTLETYEETPILFLLKT